MRTSLKFELRAPDFGAAIHELYTAALDMAAFGDEIGIARINLQEHHGFDDNFMPTPFVMGGGVAARTKRCRINLGAVLLPLHDPVKIAEQIAVLDQLSGGRLEVILGAGYVPWEFQTFRRSMHDRARLMDEGIEILLRALCGERFHHNGREIYVRPLPIQRPEDILLVGGGVEASAKRAARFGLGFAPTVRGLLGIYEAECHRLGHAPGITFGSSSVNDVHLTEDPEGTWPLLLPHLKHAVGNYAKIADETGTNTPFRGMTTDEERLKNSGLLAVWTPRQLVDHARKTDKSATISFSPLMAGLAPEIGWKSLHLLKTIMPALEVIRASP